MDYLPVVMCVGTDAFNEGLSVSDISFSLFDMLTLPVLIPCEERKSTEIFIFILCYVSKGFMKA